MAIQEFFKLSGTKIAATYSTQYALLDTSTNNLTKDYDQPE